MNATLTNAAGQILSSTRFTTHTLGISDRTRLAYRLAKLAGFPCLNTSPLAGSVVDFEGVFEPLRFVADGSKVVIAQ